MPKNITVVDHETPMMRSLVSLEAVVTDDCVGPLGLEPCYESIPGG
ncbi:hypothetical protein [Stieleria mannarensis]|nr:hypothetical protein [Rhodopirellula sp. JC639]